MDSLHPLWRESLCWAGPQPSGLQRNRCRSHLLSTCLVLYFYLPKDTVSCLRVRGWLIFQLIFSVVLVGFYKRVKIDECVLSTILTQESFETLFSVGFRDTSWVSSYFSWGPTPVLLGPPPFSDLCMLRASRLDLFFFPDSLLKWLHPVLEFKFHHYAYASQIYVSLLNSELPSQSLPVCG